MGTIEIVYSTANVVLILLTIAVHSYKLEKKINQLRDDIKELKK
jgi:hypothetical protein